MSSINQFSNTLEEIDSNFPYMPPCIRCKSIIEFASLRFHCDTIPFPIKFFNDYELDNKFGIIDIKIRSEIPINTKHIHMFFTIDGSGSMSDICSDGRTKMKHIHHTLENMLRIFHENTKCDISVHVQSFDTFVKTIIKDITNICDANLEELTSLVHSIYPGGSTNIEIALEKAQFEINEYHTLHPEHEIVHIFLTDGEITNGSANYDLLKELVPQNCTNIFIGYGEDHDSRLLSHLSSKKGDEYRFIDALEKAGLVYGEVIHGILYKAIEDVILKVTNGELYDFKTNSWISELQIGNLLSEQMKTFHVRSKNIDECHISVIGKTIIQTRKFQTINVYENQMDISQIKYLSENKDLGIYVFRQRTQELLYEARKHSDKYNEITLHNSTRYIEHIDAELTSVFEEIKHFKVKLNQFHTLMINYMKEKNLNTDPIMNMLCDDIYIAYKTTGTSIGNMYTCARQTSNGRQQTYVCSATTTQPICPPIFYQPIRVQRQTAGHSVSFSEESNIFDTNYSSFDGVQQLDLLNELNALDNYIPSQNVLSPFSSNEVITLMREVSGNYSIGKTDDEIESDKTTEII